MSKIITKKNKPIILDIGCGDFPHFFGLTDCFPDFTYIGIDKQFDNDIEKVGNFLHRRNKNFHFLKMDLYDLDTVWVAIKKITKGEKVDLVLMEHLAVGISDNKPTDALITFLIEYFIFEILDPLGSLHIDAASFHPSTHKK